MPASKICVATRTTFDQFDKCIEKFEELDCGGITKYYIICDARREIQDPFGKKIFTLFDENPIRPTSFNLVLDEVKKEEVEEHIFTFSKEVEVRKEHIEQLVKELDHNVIVAGYKLRDNVLSDQEYEVFSNGYRGRPGIAYLTPWNTCALWNKKFINVENGLWFDDICEKENNQLSQLRIKIEEREEETAYEGMEDSLAIARLLTMHEKANLKYKLLNNTLAWNISDGDEVRLKHKKKMARKNIVLTTFMNIKGYSIDQLVKAGD